MFARRFDLAALGALTLICAVVFAPLLSGQTYYYGDLNLYFHPLATFWKSQVAQGRVPLWNAGILGGTPFVGNPQMWILYPSALLFLVCPAVLALALTTWLHLWLGGVFCYGWMRRGHLQLKVLPSLLGACVWMLSGFLVSKTQFPNMLQSLAWVPAVLWAGEGLAARANGRATLTLGGVLGLQLLAGHAQISLFSLYMLAIYLPFLWLQSAERAGGWRVLARAAGALGLAGLLACGQLLPVVEALSAVQRQSLTLEGASRFAIAPQTLITVLRPDFYGDPMAGNWNSPARPGNFWETVCYLGMVPLGLALLAICRARRARFWALWSAGFLWLATGVGGGLYALAFAVLPGLSRFHDAGRFGVGWSIGGAVLAALGAQWLCRRRARWVALALLLTVADLGVFARGIYPFRSLQSAQTPPPALWGRDAMIEARQGRLWQPDFLRVWSELQPVADFRTGDAANARALFDSAPSNRSLMSGWLAESGYEPLFDRATARRLGALDWRLPLPPDIAARLGRNSVRIIQIFGAQPLPPTPGLRLVYRSPWIINGNRLFYYRNEKALPRARWNDGAQTSAGVQWRAARIVGETSSQIELEVPARAQILELADAMRPGWRAYEDGAPLPLQTTAEGWRRLQLPRAPGDKTRRVAWVYAPQVWKLGVFVSLCALGFCCAWATARRR